MGICIWDVPYECGLMCANGAEQLQGSKRPVSKLIKQLA